jgi:DNA-binding transcriptional regulator YiaG
VTQAVRCAAEETTSRRRIAASGLSDVFGIDMADGVDPVKPVSRKKTADPESSKPPLKPRQPAAKSGAKKPVMAAKPAKAKKKAATSAGAPFPEPLTGAAIRSWREALKETQADFAARVSVTAASISNWKKKGGHALGVRDATLIALRAAWKLTYRKEA